MLIDAALPIPQSRYLVWNCNSFLWGRHGSGLHTHIRYHIDWRRSLLNGIIDVGQNIRKVDMRDNSGKFIDGHSGNPGGRPKDQFKVAELARSSTVEAVETLVDLMRHRQGR